MPFPAIKKEKITAAYLRKNLRYFPTSGKLRWKIVYGSRSKNKTVGSVSDGGRIVVRLFRRMYKAHRLIWLMQTGKWPSRQIDHRNTNPSDNRWRNLRLATNGQNGHNSKRKKRSKSGYKGVQTCSDGRHWFSTITVNKKRHYLGYFYSPYAAHLAYRKAAKHYCGEFARF